MRRPGPVLAQLKRDMLYPLGKLLNFQVGRVCDRRSLDRFYEARGKLQVLDVLLGHGLLAFGPRHVCFPRHRHGSTLVVAARSQAATTNFQLPIRPE